MTDPTLPAWSRENDLLFQLRRLREENERLREALALAQPEQEPVAWMDIDEKGAASGLRYWSEPDNRHEVALYITPPQRMWVSLTDDEAQWLYDNCRTPSNLIDMTEAKLKENNTSWKP